MTILSIEVCNNFKLLPTGKHPHKQRSGGYSSCYIQSSKGYVRAVCVSQ